MLKLYLMRQEVNNNWDTYDSCVVSAYDIDDAKSIHPCGEPFSPPRSMYYDWVTDKSEIQISEIGVANAGVERGIIVASFNAG